MINLSDLRGRILSAIIGLYTIFQVIINTSIVNETQNAQLVYRISVILLILVALAVLLNTDYIVRDFRNAIFFLVALSITFIIFCSHGYNNIIFAFWMPFMALSIGIKKVLKIDFVCRFFVFLCIILLAQIGIISNGNIIDGSSGRLRYALGFSNPNSVSQIVLALLIEVLILNGGQLFRKNVMFVVLTSGVITFFSRSRTAIALVVTLLVVNMIVSKCKKQILRFPLIKMFFFLIPIVCLILSYWIVKRYLINPDELIQYLDTIMSGRIHFAAYYFQHFPINGFGNNFITQQSIGSTVTTNYGALDNGYLSLLVRFGYVVTGVFITAYSICCWKIASNEKYILLIPGVLIMLLLGLSETVFYFGAYNVTLYCLCVLMRHKGEVIDE